MKLERCKSPRFKALQSLVVIYICELGCSPVLVMVISPDMILEVASQPEMPHALPNTAPARMDQHSLSKVLPLLSKPTKHCALGTSLERKALKCVGIGHAALSREEHRQA